MAQIRREPAKQSHTKWWALAAVSLADLMAYLKS
jgi:hypothetical protein